jgi:hypothetical protein
MDRLQQPKQNGHTERMIGTLMADWLLLEEWDTFAEGHVLVTRVFGNITKSILNQPWPF